MKLLFKIKYNPIIICFSLYTIFILISSLSFSQKPFSNIDSIKFELLKTKEIEKKCNLLNKLALKYNEINLDSALFYAHLAFKYANQTGNRKQTADAYYSLGTTFKNKSISDSAYIYLFNSLKNYEGSDDIENTIKLHIAIGEYYRSVYLLNKAIQFERKAIAISFRKNTFTYLPSAYNRLGSIYFELSVNNAVIDSFYTDTVNIAIAYIDSSVFWSVKNHTNQLSISNNNILGACYQNLKKYDNANKYLLEALLVAKQSNELIEMPMIYRNLSTNFLKLKQYNQAITMAVNGGIMADSLKLNVSLWQNYYALFKIFEELKNTKQALFYLKRADSLQPIIFNQNTIAKTKEFEAKYKNKENELRIEHQDAEIDKQKLQFVFIFVGFVATVLIIFAGIFFILRIKKINKLLDNKNKEINKLSQFKDDLTSMIVHDLKNPLNTIINFSKLVNNPETSDITDIKDKNKSIESSAFHMLGIVNNIIELQKYEDTKISLDSTLNIIENTIKSAVENVNLLLAQKNISVINSISLEYVSEYDNNLIERVIINLLTNAIKFSPNNGRITIDGRVADNFITIKVTDQGKGIPEDKIPQLFNKYARAEIKEIGFSSSSGLGLAFSKLVVNAHGGEIGVDSEYSKGSCFWFTLPIIKKIKVTVKTKPEFSEYLPEFSNNFLRNIAPLRKTLSTFQFYETSEILITIQTYNCNDPEFKTWKTQLENAVLFSNKERFAELIQIEL